MLWVDYTNYCVNNTTNFFLRDLYQGQVIKVMGIYMVMIKISMSQAWLYNISYQRATRFLQ